MFTFCVILVVWVIGAFMGINAATPDEQVICAAIRLEDGRIIMGHRHDDCIQTAIKWRDAGQEIGQLHTEQQGFVTSENRFVDRVEALRIQRAAGLFYGPDEAKILFSEDLYQDQ